MCKNFRFIRRWTRVLVGALTVALLATACGGDKDDGFATIADDPAAIVVTIQAPLVVTGYPDACSYRFDSAFGGESGPHELSLGASDRDRFFGPELIDELDSATTYRFDGCVGAKYTQDVGVFDEVVFDFQVELSGLCIAEAQRDHRHARREFDGGRLALSADALEQLNTEYRRWFATPQDEKAPLSTLDPLNRDWITAENELETATASCEAENG